jgi:thioredoxin 1
MPGLPLLNDHRSPNPKAVLGIIVLLLAVLIGPPGCQKGSEPEQPKASPPTDAAALPRLLDLGAGKCIPCKKMAPILEELKEEYAGAMEVVFIDVWQDHSAGDKYGIQMIPTQIFYDASGKELFRHEGFFAKEEILAKWKELGITLQPKNSAAPERT